MHPGARDLITDVARLKVGNAQDDVLKSGSTVVISSSPFTASVHVMAAHQARVKLICWHLINLSLPLMLWFFLAVLLLG